MGVVVLIDPIEIRRGGEGERLPSVRPSVRPSVDRAENYPLAPEWWSRRDDGVNSRLHGLTRPTNDGSKSSTAPRDADSKAQ